MTPEELFNELKRLSTKLEKIPENIEPFTEEERAALKSVAAYVRHIDSAVWLWGKVGKISLFFLVVALTQWDRITKAVAAAFKAWSGQ